MERTVFLVVFVVIASCKLVVGQFTFGVSPGLNLNSAYFGYKMGKAVPNIGFQYMNIGLSIEDSGDPDYNVEAKGTLFIPHIGCKFFFIEKNKVKAYGSVSIAKPFLSGKVTSDGEDDESVEEVLDNLKLFGGQFGFGTEYFFDENFSVGGEFGFRFLHIKSETSYTESNYGYNPDTGHYDYYETKETLTTIGNINPTYSRISLNFYF